MSARHKTESVSQSALHACRLTTKKRPPQQEIHNFNQNEVPRAIHFVHDRLAQQENDVEEVLRQDHDELILQVASL
jgi:G3E family GTPase